MALVFLSIPVMSAECERVFSCSKILISDRRNRLHDDIYLEGREFNGLMFELHRNPDLKVSMNQLKAN